MEVHSDNEQPVLPMFLDIRMCCVRILAVKMSSTDISHK